MFLIFFLKKNIGLNIRQGALTVQAGFWQIITGISIGCAIRYGKTSINISTK
jgi:hypothetical protein